ncbi:MAG: hypothetical protein EHM90_02215 [Chloroflexi bacterium]|nr:MAG: hypothetical protein EHM90_02215 [Chloroflexota bacterium]
MEEEERVIYERDKARCEYRANQLRQLSGDPEAAAEVREAFAPLLRTPGYVGPACVMPYEAPDLLP